uniref:Zinc finger PHD-type domain-containing protein n=1 Tax=Timema monikensis TaxID=170555 RepID=A0A7R9E8Y4_9NEOP|nr:unnamed protein product [Timema monikensis]
MNNAWGGGQYYHATMNATIHRAVRSDGAKQDEIVVASTAEDGEIEISLCDEYSLPVDFVNKRRPHSFGAGLANWSTPSPTGEKVEVVEAYSDPRDSKAYLEPGDEASGKLYTSPDRDYSQPYTGESLLSFTDTSRDYSQPYTDPHWWTRSLSVKVILSDLLVTGSAGFGSRPGELRGTVPRSLGRFRNAFTVDMENELAEHCRQLDSRFYGLTRRQLMKLSFEFAEFKGVSSRFNCNKKIADEYFAPEEVNYRIEANETDNFAENAIEPAYSTVQSSTNIMERTEDILANSSNTVLSAEHIHYQENDSNSAPNQRSLQGIDSIHPIPKSQNEKKRHRAHQMLEVLSATPFKNCLLQKEKEKLEKEERKNQRNKRKMENAANKLDFSKPSTSKKASLPKSVKTNKETFCGGCGELFEEDWVQCGSCSEWWHEACSAYDEIGPFVCDNC